MPDAGVLRMDESMKSMKLKNEIEIALFAVLLAVFSWTTIPFAVPFTLQTFGVYVALMMLGGKRGTIAIALYILLGAVGVPVFSGFNSGIGALLGPTGGYIFGFLVTGLVYILMEKRTFRFRAPVSLVIGTLLCYAFGTIWFVIVYSQKNGPISVWTALLKCVIPFILPDAAKLVLADMVSRRVKKLL